MIRPKRRFIMPLSAARDSRKADGQIDGEHRLPVLVLHPHEQAVAGDAGIVDENVEPAGAASAAGTSSSTAALSARSQGSDDGTRLPSSAARASSASRARAGKRDCRALRVQGAGNRGAEAAAGAGDERVLPVRSNIAETPGCRVQPVAEAERLSISAGVADEAARAFGRCASPGPTRTLPAPNSTNSVDALRRPYRPCTPASAPCRVTCATSRSADLVRDRVTGAASTLATSGTTGGRMSTPPSAARHGVGGRLHQGAMEGRRHRQQHRAPGALRLGDLHRPLDRGLGAGNDDLAAAIVIGDLADGCRPARSLRLAGDPRRLLEVERREAPPWRRRRPAPPSAWPGRAGAAAARHRRS